MMARERQSGFTLIELLVALVILTLLSVAGYRALNALLDTHAHVTGETRKWQHLEFFFSRMEQDLAQVIHRPVSVGEGAFDPELVGRPATAAKDEAELEFTRVGVTGQGVAMLPPQRMGYRFQDGSIELLRWPYPDRAPGTEPLRYPLLDGVNEFKLRYLELSGNWLDQWPPGTAGLLPMAVEVTLVLQSGEHITRVFALQ